LVDWDMIRTARLHPAQAFCL